MCEGAELGGSGKGQCDAQDAGGWSGEECGCVLQDTSFIRVGTRGNTSGSDVQRSGPALWHQTCPVRCEAGSVYHPFLSRSPTKSEAALVLPPTFRPPQPKAGRPLSWNKWGRGSTHISSGSKKLNLKPGRVRAPNWSRSKCPSIEVRKGMEVSASDRM